MFLLIKSKKQMKEKIILLMLFKNRVIQILKKYTLILLIPHRKLQTVY